ncbi:putative chromate transport protein [Usitatibacter rugosus]|uniref:Putative chromate transport protein n=1 Tax=Usitatibacter rugosus TaxID=2732067 RepID=A0A6M4GTI4_9PROT|nr:chromate efflux transporter [Usitatibacter rugosus]QJR10416.1 putative chromate transport protein [Usitatibacter rugosus]
MSAPPHVTFGEALRFWLKLGFVSFGGPAGQIAIMHRELVERRRWISERRFLHALNYCMLLPGPEAQQLATYIGWLMHGVRGGIAAGALFVLPSLVILVALSWIYVRYGQVPAVNAALEGVKPAVVAIVLAAAWRIGSRTLRSAPLVAIAVVAFVALVAFSVPFPALVAGAALAGWIGGKWAPGAFALPAHASKASGGHAPAVIDDDTPTPEHARFSKGRLAAVVSIALALWGASLGALVLAFGWDAGFTRMGMFFTQAALVTFGGAYAVLPYVVQGAVEQHGWLTGAQMIDGLALGETTPGPLIMVVAFVGFLGGWTRELLGAQALLAAGILGASVATWFTFLPSFLFILAGGPLVEGTRDDVRLAPPLTAITAAVVGVIASLALYFGSHVFWKGPGGFDIGAGLIGLAALVALTRFRVGVIPVIGASALAGVLAWMAGA